MGENEICSRMKTVLTERPNASYVQNSDSTVARSEFQFHFLLIVTFHKVCRFMIVFITITKFCIF